MKTVLRGAGLALLVAGAAALPAAGQGTTGQGGTGGTCGDLIDRFAAARNLAAEPPPMATPPGTAGSSSETTGTVTSRELARSGGVITPPPVGDTPVIDPPRPRVETMPTAPAIRPDAGQTGEPQRPSGGAVGQAAVRAQMEALVTAGRAAARRGDEAQCMDSLNQARRLSDGSAGARPEGGG